MGRFNIEGTISTAGGFVGYLVVLAIGLAGGVAWEYRPHFETRLPIPIWRPLVALPDGLRVQRDQARAKLALAKPQVQAREHVAAAISADIGQAITKTQLEVRTRTVTLTKEIPVYVTAEADRACTVGTGFVQLHDAAAEGKGTLPAAAGGSGPVDAPSGIELSTVASTVIANYGVAYGWKAEAEGWRRWYFAQSAAWNAKSP